MRSRALLGALALLGAACSPSAHASIARPNPVLVSVHLDYVSPLRGSAGGPAALTPLDPAVVQQAVADERYLHYRIEGDLGGFVLAPIGASAWASGGRAVVGGSGKSSEIPQYGQAAEGVVRSFAFIGAGQRTGGWTPQNGRTPVRGLGPPPELPAPSNSNAVPPPNEGFGGRPANPSEGGKQPSGGKSPSGKPEGGKGGSGGKSKSHPGGKQPPPVTTPSTPPVVTPPPTEEGGQGGGGSGGGGASCGTIGLAVSSDHASCRIYAVNMEPGRSASETMTIRDEADVPFTLSLRASGEENRLWQDLRMGVWQAGGPAPDPLPALLLWTTQDNALTTLGPGQEISYEVELYLPLSAGNEDQGETALIDLTWSAHQ